MYAHNEPIERVTFEICQPDAAARSINSRRVRSFLPRVVIICGGTKSVSV